MTNISIFDSRGKFTPLPDAERDALGSTEKANYEAVADAAQKCEASENLCISLEAKLIAMTADIREMESKLANYPKPDRIAETRRVLMQDGR